MSGFCSGLLQSIPKFINRQESVKNGDQTVGKRWAIAI
jgi:hypothetical protein